MGLLSVALTGNPNTGKSTIFNELTGAKQKIGNWPGVTVDKKIGYINHAGRAISVVDLPGTYSINSRSPEEKIVENYLMDEKPDIVVNVVDAANIERNLFLTLQLLEQRVPLLLDLNMMDEAKAHGIEISARKLGDFLGMPVVETVGRSRASTQKLLAVFTDTVMSDYTNSDRIEEHIEKIDGIRAQGLEHEAEEEAVIGLRYGLIDEIMTAAVVKGAAKPMLS
ncbi:MAG: FeoB small GTPase domain-containing protein, partial [Selenomonadaceae bacterium]